MECTFAVLAAHNGRSHIATTILAATLFTVDGQPVAIDVGGVEAYTAKTFSPDRYTHLDHAVGLSQPAHHQRRYAA